MRGKSAGVRGMQAFHDGLPLTANPYTQWKKRDEWEQAYLAAERRSEAVEPSVVTRTPDTDS